MTMRGGEGRLRKERNTELTSKTVRVDLIALPKLTNLRLTVDYQSLLIHHLIHDPTSKPLYIVWGCQLNTLDPLLPPVLVAGPLPPVLDPQARPDPPTALDLLPIPRPIMHTIKGHSSSPGLCHREGTLGDATPAHHGRTSLWRSRRHQIHGGVRKPLLPHQDWLCGQRCYHNVPVLLLGNDPGDYHDEEQVSEEGLGAVERGAEGRLQTHR